MPALPPTRAAQIVIAQNPPGSAGPTPVCRVVHPGRFLKDADDELLINSLSMLLEFESEDKQALLEAPSLMTRRETLITLIEYSMRGGNSDEMLQ